MEDYETKIDMRNKGSRFGVRSKGTLKKTCFDRCVSTNQIHVITEDADRIFNLDRLKNWELVEGLEARADQVLEDGRSYAVQRTIHDGRVKTRSRTVVPPVDPSCSEEVEYSSHKCVKGGREVFESSRREVPSYVCSVNRKGFQVKEKRTPGKRQMKRELVLAEPEPLEVLIRVDQAPDKTKFPRFHFPCPKSCNGFKEKQTRQQKWREKCLPNEWAVQT
eukprot:GILJ01002915.1.p1 GENE.GILJ01002915.1~~GILJ01002915.1.p1  ORF type:complete len:220 (+),score=17.51 GILJ01002915.1:245-904(+)